MQIDKIQDYYGLATRRNKYSTEDMNNEVWPIYYHTISTNVVSLPRHGFCPTGKDSWCGSNKLEATQPEETTYDLKHSLPVAVKEK